jgi:hypothetical protein
MLHPDLPNLIFIGRTSTFINILTCCLQARWLAELIAGRFALPGREAMLAEIAELKVWKRGWMPFSAARGARLLLHMLSYHDDRRPISSAPSIPPDRPRPCFMPCTARSTTSSPRRR